MITPARRRTRRAFSLMELLIAIAILLAIGAIVVVNFLPQKEQADRDLALTQIDAFEQAIELFRKDLSRFPTTEEGLAVLWTKDSLEDQERDAAKWKGPYLAGKAAKLEDHWGNAWVYTYPSEERPDLYKIVSLGPDGEESADDITSFDRFRDAEGELTEEFSSFGAAEEGG
jgi:general secretion pathway protein G